MQKIKCKAWTFQVEQNTCLRQDPVSVHAFIEVMKIKVHQRQPHASPQTGMLNDKW